MYDVPWKGAKVGCACPLILARCVYCGRDGFGVDSSSDISSADWISVWVCGCRCLNRYYGADGLRLYSQETWQLVMGSTGREEVAKCVDVVLDYYIAQSAAENHLVKEVRPVTFLSKALHCAEESSCWWKIIMWEWCVGIISPFAIVVMTM